MKNTIIAIAFLIIITTLTVAINPQMHKPVSIGGSQIAVSNRDIVQNKDIKVANQDSLKNIEKTTVKPVKQIKNSNNISTKTIEADKNMEKLLKAQAQEDAKAKTQTYQAPSTKEAKKTSVATTKTVKKTAQQPKKTTQVSKTPAETTQKPVEKPQTSKISEAKIKKQVEQILTEYEETILWNKWHAKVANTVAENLPQSFSHIVPLGSIYRYDFIVNSNGQISNIKVRLTRGYVNANTNQGAAMIHNSIRSLNRSSILAFPKGTQRTSVTVSSGIQRTETSQPINENAFNDAETIIRQIYQNVN